MTTLIVYSHAALLMALYYVAGYISHRHGIPMVALLLPMTGAGLFWIAERVAHAMTRWMAIVSSQGGSSRAARRIAIRAHWLTRPGAVAAALALIAAACLLPTAIRPLHRVYQPIVEAADWVRMHSRPDGSVLSTSADVRFYAQRYGVVLGAETPNLAAGIAIAPTSCPWTNLVLEIDDRTLDGKCQKLLDRAYERVLDLAAHPRKPWLRIWAFQLKPA